MFSVIRRTALEAYSRRTVSRMTSSTTTTTTGSSINRLLQHSGHLRGTSSNCSTSNMASKVESPPLRILMLHGYTQNGPLFNAKTKVLTKTLLKVFPSVTFSFPTGPLRLNPADVPGFDTSALQAPDVETEFFGWWRRSDTSTPPEYVGLDKGLETIANVLRDEGPFDGVMGFSQGAAMAAMVASLLDTARQSAFDSAKQKSDLAVSYPASFRDLDHPPLKFCVAYCGFPAPGQRYRGFYDDPTIQTPMLHVIGSLDSVVEESRTRALIDAAGGEVCTKVLVHPGGHFVPNGKQYVEAVATFIKDTLNASGAKGGEKGLEEERVEDMDVPF